MRSRNRADIRKSCLHNTEETLFPFLLVFPMSYFYTYLGSGSFTAYNPEGSLSKVLCKCHGTSYSGFAHKVCLNGDFVFNWHFCTQSRFNFYCIHRPILLIGDARRFRDGGRLCLMIGFGLDGVFYCIDMLALQSTEFKVWTRAMRLFSLNIYCLFALARL